MNCSAEARGRFPKRLWLIAALLAALVLGSHSRGAEPAPGGAGEDLLARQQELKKLKGEIETNRQKIKELAGKERDLAERSDRLRRDEALTRRYLEELAEQDLALRDDLALRQSDYLDKSMASEEKAGRLRERLRQFYKLRHVHGAELFFSSKDFNELFARAQFVARWIERDRLDLMALGQERERISAEAAVLDSRRRGIESLAAEKRSEEDRLRRQGQTTAARLLDVRAERKKHEARIAELERTEAAIRKVLARLTEESKKSKKSKTSLGTGGLSDLRGRLIRPVEGKTITRFGYEVHPIYGTRVPMNGIEIQAEPGTAIRAAAEGTAKFVDWLPGYGNTVILEHGAGWFTLYAHASEVLVRQGEKIAAGQVIARVGDSDSIRGPLLHFEVRHDEQALDPDEWIR